MPLPSSGKITTQTFRDFFEISSSTPISSSDWYRGGPYVRANYQTGNGNSSINNQVPTSGRITLSDLYGVYKVVPASSLTPGNSTEQDITPNPPNYPNTPDEPAALGGDGNNTNVGPPDPWANPPSTTNATNQGNGPMNPPNNDYGAGPAGANQDPYQNTATNNVSNGGTVGYQNSPDAALPPALRDPYAANQNPPTGNNNYTFYTPGNTNPGNPNPGNPSDPGQFGNGDLNPGGSNPPGNNPGNWTYADPKPPGNYNYNSSNQGNGPMNPPNNDYGAGPSGTLQDSYTNNVTTNTSNFGNAGYQNSPDLGGVPGTQDPFANPVNTNNPPNETATPPTYPDSSLAGDEPAPIGDGSDATGTPDETGGNPSYYVNHEKLV
jgi:hypothetical protein